MLNSEDTIFNRNYSSVVILGAQRCRIPKLKKKLESKNEITIVDEYKYERQRVCEHRHIFLLPK